MLTFHTSSLVKVMGTSFRYFSQCVYICLYKTSFCTFKFMWFIFPDNINGRSSLLKIISPDLAVTSMLANDTHLSTQWFCFRTHYATLLKQIYRLHYITLPHAESEIWTCNWNTCYWSTVKKQELSHLELCWFHSINE